MEWISVKDRMPDDGQIVFVLTRCSIENGSKYFAPLLLQYRPNDDVFHCTWWRTFMDYEWGCAGRVHGWDPWYPAEDEKNPIMYWSPIIKPDIKIS